MTRIEWIDKYLADAERMIYDNNLQEAMHVMTNLLYEEPGYGNLHNHVGWAHLYYTGDMQMAEMHLKLATKFNGSFAAPYLHLANLYIRTNRHMDALPYLEKGVLLSDANRVAFYECMANVYELNKEYKKAVNAYKTALVHCIGHESHVLMEGVKRCRKKRITLMFSF